MTDLEITRLCAEAMNYIHGAMWERKTQPTAITVVKPEDPTMAVRYDPLRDKGQQMELLEAYRLRVNFPIPNSNSCWVTHVDEDGSEFTESAQDAGGAICLCIAQIQAAK